MIFDDDDDYSNGDDDEDASKRKSAHGRNVRAAGAGVVRTQDEEHDANNSVDISFDHHGDPADEKKP